MAYKELTIPWTNPVVHEKEIYETRVYDIFYFRILIFLLIALVFMSQLILVLDDNFLGLMITTFVWIMLFIFLFPVFLDPLDLVLSNKRLLLRSRRFWFFGRFSKIITYNLLHLESQSVSPRIKVIPVLFGFFLLQTVSFPLIELALTGTLPFPLFMSLIFVYGSFIDFISTIQLELNQLTILILGPFFDIAFVFGVGTLLIAVALISFGLPFRKVMVLSTTGGHKFTLDAGIPFSMTNVLYAVGRKERIRTKIDTQFEWDIPLLENEKILSYGKIGLVNYWTQLLGFLTLLLFIESIEYISNLFENITIEVIIVVALYTINFVFIIFMVIFSKRYHRIIATTHRLLFQEERIAVSGLWGKRIYQYSDLSKRDLQGFSVSRFTGITFYSMVGIFLLILIAIRVLLLFPIAELAFVFTIIIIIAILISYKAYTRLEFRALSGNIHLLAYRLPVVIERIAHRLEDYDRLHNLIFANILTDEDIINLCNNIRDIKNPVIPTYKYHGSEPMNEDAFIDTQEAKHLQKWQKYGPAPYIRLSIILGAIFALITIPFLVPLLHLNPDLETIFILITILAVVIFSIRRYILLFYTLIITPSRVLFVKQKLPRNLSRVLGILPEWSLEEVHRNQILLSHYKLFIPRPQYRQISVAIVVIIGSWMYINNFTALSAFFSSQFLEGVSLLAGFLIIIFIPGCIQLIITIIPRFALSIHTRFGLFYIPYIKDVKAISKFLNITISSKQEFGNQPNQKSSIQAKLYDLNKKSGFIHLERAID